MHPPQHCATFLTSWNACAATVRATGPEAKPETPASKDQNGKATEELHRENITGADVVPIIMTQQQTMSAMETAGSRYEGCAVARKRK
jgi:hypothetical protein